jgi:hypothetical protein
MIGEAVAADWLVVLIIEEAGGFLEAAETEPGYWQVPAGAPGVRQALKGMYCFRKSSQGVSALSPHATGR